MSSIIVLDSSDEDESPSKKPKRKPTPISSVKPATAALNAGPSFASLLKVSKPRTIPNSITVTRHSPVSVSKTPAASTNSSKPLETGPAATKVNLANILNSISERKTPTPPKQQQQPQPQPLHQQQPRQLQQLQQQQQQLPQLQPAPQVQRKRKTPTPPQQLSTRLSISSSAPTTSLSTNTTTTTAMLPMISAVQSMAASTTPPLQLLATPPPGSAPSSFCEQLMINPHLIHSSLPPNTTITAHPSPHHNNINNNFKIHLPPKSITTPHSPAGSPAAAATAPKTPSPKLSPSPGPGPGLGPGLKGEKTARRIKPTTVLNPNDEAWLHQKHWQHPLIPLNEDVVIEMLPAATSSSPKPPKPPTIPNDAKTPKPQSSPKVCVTSSPAKTPAAGTVLDLTDSPEKPNSPPALTKTEPCPGASTMPNMPDIDAEPSTSSAKAKTTEIPTTTSTGSDDRVSPTKASVGETKEAPTSSQTLEPDYEELIRVCREADSSDDMEKLIKSKLLKYYYEVHPDFVRSRSFRKSVRNVIDNIRAEPDLVYYNLKTIVDELKVRRKNREVVVSNEEATTASTGNKRTDEQIKKLNKALYILTKRIEVLEETEVDWDDDDSSFLQVERFKKRACQIYEKICDLTGESKNAHRIVKKPIKFNETGIPQFNKTLQAFINRTKEFPDYFDVLRMLEHCNRTYALGLVNFEMKNIAEDAFIKVGKLLQSRRKADLYETVTHYTGNSKDPATSDPTLLAKLSDNQKNQKKISEILEKYARQQDQRVSEEKDEQLKGANNNAANCIRTEMEEAKTNNNSPQTDTRNEDDEDDDEDDDTEEDDEEEEEEEEGNLEEHVEKLTNGDISEAESEVEVTNLTEGLEKTRPETAANNKETRETYTNETPQNDVECSKRVNNNNVTRLKTATANANEETLNGVADEKTHPPNGKLKEAISQQSADTDTDADTATRPTKAATANNADLQIVDIASLTGTDADVIYVTADDKRTSAMPAKQRTVAEIVISDEES